MKIDSTSDGMSGAGPQRKDADAGVRCIDNLRPSFEYVLCGVGGVLLDAGVVSFTSTRLFVRRLLNV